MNIPTISEILLMEGQIVTIVTERNMKVKKGFDDIKKTYKFQCRLCINYEDINAVKTKRENIVKESLPWGVWKHFPFIIEHKNVEYLRCTTIENDFKAKSIYMQNGEIITAEEAKSQCYASEFPKNKREYLILK
jgi:hypothetical protein